MLKGGIFLYALFNGDYARATTDIDLLGQRINNETESIKAAFAGVFSIETDDPLKAFLGPIAEAITNNVSINGTWNHETREWELF